MTRLPVMLLCVGLVCTLVVAGCGDGGVSPTVTVTPKDARDLPTATPSPTGEYIGGPMFPTASFDPFGPDRDCDDFENWFQAVAFYQAAGGPESDPHQLDPDGTGVPCEALREQYLEE